VIASFIITILVEGTLVAFYALWQRKPLKQLFFSCLCVNLFTQSILWVVLNCFPGYYLVTLTITEICIVGMEAIILFLYRYNQLKLREAILLSLAMNLTSFGIGWISPV
jgi:biotin transporter BioY